MEIIVAASVYGMLFAGPALMMLACKLWQGIKYGRIDWSTLDWSDPDKE